jgi:hypothetical protein
MCRSVTARRKPAPAGSELLLKLVETRFCLCLLAARFDQVRCQLDELLLQELSAGKHEAEKGQLGIGQWRVSRLCSIQRKGRDCHRSRFFGGTPLRCCPYGSDGGA